MIMYSPIPSTGRWYKSFECNSAAHRIPPAGGSCSIFECRSAANHDNVSMGKNAFERWMHDNSIRHYGPTISLQYHRDELL